MPVEPRLLSLLACCDVSCLQTACLQNPNPIKRTTFGASAVSVHGIRDTYLFLDYIPAR